MRCAPRSAEPAKSKTVTVDLPKNVSVSFSPKDLAKLVAHKQVAEERAAAKVAEPAVAKAADVADLDAIDASADPAFLAVKAAEATVYKRDIDTATRRRLAGEGRALSNLSYPVETHEDAGNAVTLLLSGHGDVGAARRMVTRIARKEGWKDILERLKGGKKNKVATKAAEPDATKCMKCDGSGMMDGKPCPSCKKGKKAAKAEKRRVRKALAPAVAKKKSKIMCAGCGAKQYIKHDCAPSAAADGARHAGDQEPRLRLPGLRPGPPGQGREALPACGRENPGYIPRPTTRSRTTRPLRSV